MPPVRPPRSPARQRPTRSKKTPAKGPEANPAADSAAEDDAEQQGADVAAAKKASKAARTDGKAGAPAASPVPASIARSVTSRFALPCAAAMVLLWPSGFMLPPADPAHLVWSDEFDSVLDPAKWTFDLQPCPDWGWGNNEMQRYTDDPDNAWVHNGTLNIRARCRSENDCTSARILTKASWTYGRIEVRLKMPLGRGTWAGAWMLPTDHPCPGPADQPSWPLQGEIDIVEHCGMDVFPPPSWRAVLYGGNVPVSWMRGAKSVLPYLRDVLRALTTWDSLGAAVQGKPVSTGAHAPHTGASACPD